MERSLRSEVRLLKMLGEADSSVRMQQQRRAGRYWRRLVDILRSQRYSHSSGAPRIVVAVASGRYSQKSELQSFGKVN